MIALRAHRLWLQSIAALAIVLATTLSVPADAPAKKAAEPFAAKVVGTGRPIIFIPGLACSGEVWEGTVKHFSKKYQCHVLTLAGFAGQPSVEGPFLDTMQKAIADYIHEKKLDHPIIIGHSIGGFLTYMMGINSPELVGPLVSVDGVPFLAGMIDESVTAEQGKKRGEEMAKRMAAVPHDDFVKQQQGMLAAWIKNPEQLTLASKWGAASDQKTVGIAMADMFGRDLRQDVAKIKSPTLLIAAPAEFGNVTQEALMESYRKQVAKNPKIEVVFANKSRHFIMFDQPDLMNEQIEKFLVGSGK